MAKQTLVFESAKELSLNNGMIVITDRESGEIVLRALEDVQMIMVDHHSVRLSIPLIVKLVMNNVSIVLCDEKQKKEWIYSLFSSLFVNFATEN